ncbi:hypothetical protein ACOSP7_023957 [Xanthoceras sorbifolium]
MSTSFQELLQHHGIISQRSCPSIPQQNRVAERKNHHLLDVVRSLLLESYVPSRFWCEALSTAIHLINRLTSPSLNHVSHFTRLFGHPPDYSNLRTFGCVCFSVQCAFLGYSVHQKGFLCYDPHLHRIRISRNVIFLENQNFFTTHIDSPFPFPSISTLPLFTNSSADSETSKPLIVYQRHPRTTSNQVLEAFMPSPGPSPIV